MIHHTNQRFFRVWRQYGLKRAATIKLIETKQVSPDKHLFGHSHFASNINASNVVIQLGKIPGRLSRSNRRDRLSKQANKINKIKMNGESGMHTTNNNRLEMVITNDDDDEYEYETPIATDGTITTHGARDPGLDSLELVKSRSNSGSIDGICSTADGSCYGEGENDAQKNDELEGQESIL